MLRVLIRVTLVLPRMKSPRESGFFELTQKARSVMPEDPVAFRGPKEPSAMDKRFLGTMRLGPLKPLPHFYRKIIFNSIRRPILRRLEVRLRALSTAMSRSDSSLRELPCCSSVTTRASLLHLRQWWLLIWLRVSPVGSSSTKQLKSRRSYILPSIWALDRGSMQMVAEAKYIALVVLLGIILTLTIA